MHSLCDLAYRHGIIVEKLKLNFYSTFKQKYCSVLNLAVWPWLIDWLSHKLLSMLAFQPSNSNLVMMVCVPGWYYTLLDVIAIARLPEFHSQGRSWNSLCNASCFSVLQHARDNRLRSISCLFFVHNFLTYAVLVQNWLQIWQM